MVTGLRVIQFKHFGLPQVMAPLIARVSKQQELICLIAYSCDIYRMLLALAHFINQLNVSKIE